MVLARLRELNREQFQRTLGRYLSPQQLDALEVRRALLVRHFNDLIASKGEAAVLYQLRAQTRDRPSILKLGRARSLSRRAPEGQSPQGRRSSASITP